MTTTENNSLFTTVSEAQSASVCGGAIPAKVVNPADGTNFGMDTLTALASVLTGGATIKAYNNDGSGADRSDNGSYTVLEQNPTGSYVVIRNGGGKTYLKIS